MVLWLFGSLSTAEDDKQLRQFSWIYGSLPAAPASYVFATQYDAEPAMIAGAVVLSLILTAPLMYLFTFLITVSPNSSNESNLVDVINSMPTQVVATATACAHSDNCRWA